MKHSVKVTLILLGMFFAAQLIGIYVAGVYLPETVQVVNETSGEIVNITEYNLPYGIEPPQDTEPNQIVFLIVFALFFAVFLMFMLMKLRAETFLRLWFLVVITLGIAIALNALFVDIGLGSAALIALIVSLPLAILKVFQRNIIVHNITELLIYPGIATVFIPLLNVWAVVILLVLISLYDIYAVWHAGFMQKMAQYQIQKLRVFSGFFVPYLGKKEKMAIKKAKESGKKTKKVNVNVAILGGGDVVFPIILAGVVLRTFGLLPALIISVGATIALAILFILSEKGKFYPAMPFISAGCLVALAIAAVI